MFSSCGSKIEQVTEATEKGEDPELTLDAVQAATKEGEWEAADAGKYIDEAVHDLEEISSHVRK